MISPAISAPRPNAVDDLPRNLALRPNTVDDLYCNLGPPSERR